MCRDIGNTLSLLFGSGFTSLRRLVEASGASFNQTPAVGDLVVVLIELSNSKTAVVEIPNATVTFLGQSLVRFQFRNRFNLTLGLGSKFVVGVVFEQILELANRISDKPLFQFRGS